MPRTTIGGWTSFASGKGTTRLRFVVIPTAVNSVSSGIYCASANSTVGESFTGEKAILNFHSFLDIYPITNAMSGRQQHPKIAVKTIVMIVVREIEVLDRKSVV